MHLEVNYFSLAIIFFIAFLSPLIAGKIRFISIPEIIIQIFAGIIIGTSGFNLIKDSEAVSFLSSLGFAYLMFLSGYEVDFDLLRKVRKSNRVDLNPIKSSGAIMALTLLISFLISTILFALGIVKNVSLLTLIFSTTSLGIVVPVLKENRMTNGNYGQTVLLGALFADFSTLFLLPVIMYLMKGERDYSILYSGILFGLFIILFFVLKLLHLIDFGKNINRVTHLNVRIVLAVLFLFAVFAELMGIEIIIGAFLAGMLFSLILKNKSGQEQLGEKLDSIGFGFLIPIFFIMIGVKFDITSVFSKEMLVILPLFLIIAYVVKVIPALVILKKSFGTRKALSAGFLISSRLSLIIALSEIALENGVISASTYSTFIIVGVITCLISPVISMKLYGSSNGFNFSGFLSR